jgi:hypothetical protein
MLTALAAHAVDYVVIGGFAAIAHGSRRVTLDLDIVPSPDPENLERLASAFEDLGASGIAVDLEFQDIDATDAFDLARSRNVRVATRFGHLDVLNRPAATPPYEDLRARSIEATVAGHMIRVAGRDDLVAMKLKAGRPRDLQDIADITAEESGD